MPDGIPVFPDENGSSGKRSHDKADRTEQRPDSAPSNETEPVTIPHSAGRSLTAFIEPVRREKPRRSFASGPASTPIASDNEPTVAVIASNAPPAISSWRVSTGWACASEVIFQAPA